MASDVKLAPTNASGIETNTPKVRYVYDSQVVGLPTIPSPAVGRVANSSTAATNASRAHSCDFSLEIKKNVGVKKFLKAIAQAIRTGIRAIQRFLGLGDPSGVPSALINKLKAIAQEIKTIYKEYIKPILDFQKYVLAVIGRLKAILQWILSLPARVLSWFKGCIGQILKAIATLFSDVWSEVLAEEAAAAGDATGAFDQFGVGDPPASFGDLIGAVGEVYTAAQQVLTGATQVVTNTVAIAGAATTGLTTPTSSSDLQAADQLLKKVGTTIPSPAQIEKSITDNFSPSDSKGPA
jgi:hypothetical protein